MFGITVKKAAELCEGTLFAQGGEDTLITEAIIDSRKAAPGTMFVAYKGARSDGHDYINAVLDAGAACALAQRVPEGCKGPVIVVPDVQEGFEKLIRAFRAQLDIPVIGITGSVGKTTAKEMVSAVLSEHYNIIKNEGNFNNQIGVPMTMSRINADTELAVVEMGINHFGEMDVLARMAMPTVMLYTVIGHAHLEFLGDLDGVLKAKTEVLPYLPEDGVIIINGDDEKLRGIKSVRRIVSYGFGENCDIRAENISVTASSTEFELVYGQERVPVSIASYGKHIVNAAVEGAAVGICMGMSIEEIVRGIAGYKTVGRRAAVKKAGDITIIDDCYNSNPDSLRVGIDSLSLLKGRRVAILGDMLELGSNSALYHRQMGEYAREAGIELIISCGPLAGDINTGAGDRGVYFPTLEDMLGSIETLIRPGDNILIKASNSMHFGDVTAFLLEKFADKE